MEKQIREIPKNQMPAKQQRPQPEVLEDLVSSIRGLDMRVRESIDEFPGMRRRRARYHPMMMEFSYLSKELMLSKSDPLRFLMMIGLVKDDLPWLYELGVDAYQQTARKLPDAKQARRRVLEAFRMVRRGPWIEMFENKENYMIFRELDHFAQEFADFDDSDTDSGDTKEAAPQPKMIIKPKPPLRKPS